MGTELVGLGTDMLTILVDHSSFACTNVILVVVAFNSFMQSVVDCFYRKE